MKLVKMMLVTQRATELHVSLSLLNKQFGSFVHIHVDTWRELTCTFKKNVFNVAHDNGVCKPELGVWNNFHRRRDDELGYRHETRGPWQKIRFIRFVSFLSL